MSNGAVNGSPKTGNGAYAGYDKLEAELKNDALRRLVFGPPCAELDTPAHIADGSIDVRSFAIGAQPEQLAAPRNVVIGAIQNAWPCSPSDPLQQQRDAIHKRMTSLVEAAGAAGVQILCLQEAWPMPFAFCTREKAPWCEFAESAEEGPSTQLLAPLARKHRMVIVSPILERDAAHGGVLWNTAVVLGHDGRIIGKHRKNHIPRVGDFNESSYYMEGDTGHPVFETAYGRVGVNICYGRHHPMNWMAFALNGAEIIFNPSATVGGLSEPLWPIEARNAAIANSVYTVAINRVGTEVFPNAFTSADGEPPHNDFGHFYGSTYLAAPDGRRTPSLSSSSDGLLLCRCDLNLIQQTRDKWGFQMTGRHGMYADLLRQYTSPDFKPQIVRASDRMRSAD